MDHTSLDFDTTDGQSPLSVDDILFEFKQERIPEQFKELPGFEKLDLSARPEKEEPSSPDSGPEADAVSAGNASQADIDGWLKGAPADPPEAEGAAAESGGAGFPAEDEPEPPAPRRRREEKRSRFSLFGRNISRDINFTADFRTGIEICTQRKAEDLLNPTGGKDVAGELHTRLYITRECYLSGEV